MTLVISTINFRVPCLISLKGLCFIKTQLGSALRQIIRIFLLRRWILPWKHNNLFHYTSTKFHPGISSFRFPTLCTSCNTLAHILYIYYILPSYAQNSLQEGNFPKLLTGKATETINFNTILLVPLEHLTQSNTDKEYKLKPPNPCTKIHDSSF